MFWPRPHTPSLMLGHNILFIYAQIRFAQHHSIYSPKTKKIIKNEEKNFFSTLPTPGIEPVTKNSNYFSQTIKSKNKEKTCFNLATPGLEPSTKNFKADAKMA